MSRILGIGRVLVPFVFALGVLAGCKPTSLSSPSGPAPAPLSPTSTATSTKTSVPALTATPTNTPTLVSTVTNTPQNTATWTETFTPTSTRTSTSIATPTSTSTNVPLTSTPTATGTFTFTFTSTPTNGRRVTTYAGNAAGGSSNGVGSAASFYRPEAVAVDGSGNLYVADSDNHTIRKVTSGGVVTTLAGTAGTSGSTNGNGTVALFYSPSGIAATSSGTVYVADTENGLIRKITTTGVVTTLAGTVGSFGSVDGTGTSASFYTPMGLAVDAAGNIYVADEGNNKIRKITSAGVVTTLAGSGSLGSADGTGTGASFRHPNGVAVDASSNIYVSDTGNHLIRKITSAGVVTTLAGMVGVSGSADGNGSSASFYSPMGITVDASGNLYVADMGNNKVRQVTSTGVVTTWAGDGSYGYTNGPVATASFMSPLGVVAGTSGVVYVADTGSNMIRAIQ